MPKTNKDFQPTNATTTSTLADPIKELKTLIEEKFANLEQLMTLFENRISSQYVGIRNSISKSKNQPFKLSDWENPTRL